MGLNRDYLNTKCIAGNFKVCVWGQIKLDRLFSLSLIGFPTDNQATAIFFILFFLSILCWRPVKILFKAVIFLVADRLIHGNISVLALAS